MSYDPSEQKDIERVFLGMLRGATRDGGAKRARGEKPAWYVDGSHEAAMFSHINKWKHGERKDPESGAHPLVHLAWRALAIAWQETMGKVAPSPGVEVLRVRGQGVEAEHDCETAAMYPNTDARLPPPEDGLLCDASVLDGVRVCVPCGRRLPCTIHNRHLGQW